MVRLVTFLLLLTLQAFANVFNVTNDYTNLSTVYTNIVANEQLRVRVGVLQGTSTQNLSGYVVSARLLDGIDSEFINSYTGYVENLSNANVRVIIDSGIPVGYWLFSIFVTNDVQAIEVARYKFTVAEECSDCQTVTIIQTNIIGGQTFVMTNNVTMSISNVFEGTTLIVTNIIEGNTFIVTNIIEGTTIIFTNDFEITNATAVGAPNGYMPAVSNGAIVLGPPPAGSVGGGIQSINGNTNAAQLIVGNSPIVVTNIGGTTYIGWQEYDGAFVINPGTNYSRLYFSGSVTQQIIFSGTGTVALTGWGGAGFGTTYGGSAGLTQTILHFTNGMYLDCLIPNGGQGLTGTPAQTDSAFPNGGKGVGRQTASGGGGALVVMIGGTTNVVMVAGGGAGGLPNNAVYGGFGGGDTGGDGAGSRRGYGGTQTNGGAAGTQTGVMLYTNTAGSFLRGGHAGITTNALGAITANASGGGDGYEGGGGSFATTSESSGGGAGSGYWNPSICVWGSTVRGGSANPPGTEIPGYVAGVGVPGGLLNSTRSGVGLLLVTVLTE